MLVNGVIVGSSGKKFAEGTGRVSSDLLYFKNVSGNESNMYYVKVTKNLGFVPSFIVIINPSDATVYNKCLYNANSWTSATTNAKIETDAQYFNTGASGVVNANGFTLPFTSTPNASVEWYAYE